MTGSPVRRARARRGWARGAAASALGLALVACGPSLPRAKAEVIERLLPSSVRVSAERSGVRVRSGSGVVIHSATDPDRSLVLTTRRTVQGLDDAELYAAPGGRTKARRRATVLAVSPDVDLALLQVDGLALPPAVLGDTGQLGEEVWVVAYPWGRRFTLVGGIVSQVEAETDGAEAEGPTIMIDASVSYGASGGGVYVAATGRLIALVEGYRTARMNVRGDPKLAVEFPVAGETAVIPARAIRRFLEQAGYGHLLSP